MYFSKITVYCRSIIWILCYNSLVKILYYSISYSNTVGIRITAWGRNKHANTSTIISVKGIAF